MTFTIDNGQNICAIGLSDIGSYIRFNHPLSVMWYDCRGSVGKYFCLLPYNKDYRDTVQEKIQDNLNNDFTSRVSELHDILKPLLPIFKNGDYTLNFYANINKEFFQYQSSHDDFTDTFYNSFEVVFTDHVTDISNLEKVKADFKIALKQYDTAGLYHLPDILEYTTTNIYPGDHSFYATQPFHVIDEARVKHFEQAISNGERPFAILFNAYLAAADEQSAYYILDGHHKLLAYEKLGIYPPIAVLTHLPKDKADTEFDAEKLSTVLYPWQIEHILAHWGGKDSYIEKALSNPDSHLHTIVKNGDYEAFHDNGRLKHKAFYVNDKVDGASKDWYENGQLKSEHYFIKGIRTGTWKNYFPSGKIEFIQNFSSGNNNRYDGQLVSFYENGRKRMEQVLENGVNKDGNSYNTWFDTGDKEAQLTYKDGLMMSRKNWNNWGELVNHEVYNNATNKFEKVDIPLNEKYDHQSINYKNRQEDTRQIVNRIRQRKNKQRNEKRLSWWDKLKKLLSFK